MQPPPRPIAGPPPASGEETLGHSPRYARRTPGVVLHLGGGSAQRDPSVLQHVGAIRRVQRHEHVLLDQEQRRALAIDLLDHVDQAVDDLGREAERQLVDHQQLRPRHHAPSDRDHLLLPTRQRARLARQLVLQRREVVEHARHVVADLAIAPQVRTQEQVLLDRHRPEQAPALRHVGDALPDQHLRPRVGDVFARKRDRPGGGADQAAQDTEQSGFPSAVRADQSDQLRRRDVQVDPEQHGSGVVAGVQPPDLEQRLRT